MATPSELACRSCFWAADVTRDKERVWCAEAGAHGWQVERPACGGSRYVARKPWHHSIEAYERHAAGLAD
ncbi:MAG: hypothetical protein RIS35_781 [Pseudomonadota bacterium]|jgi:hypothetical protein